MEKQKPVVLITGASRGLGEALTYYFAERNYSIAICSRHLKEIQKVKKKAEKLGASVIALEVDVTHSKEVDRLISVTEYHFGSIDIVINNASIFGPGPCELTDYDEQAFRNVLTTNVLNPFLVTKRVLSGMLVHNQGLVITITSEAGITGFAEWGAYGISKFAVEGLIQTWSDELADYEVELCLVDPGEMNTKMHERAVPNCDYSLLEPNQLLPFFDYLLSLKGGRNGQRYSAPDFLEANGYV
ncbi:SDR family NAD(P)-dependent oxidoreductase [Alkalihalobacillus trypoxylicola]|uniref:3-oxoacyl-ACP reductase n=1 Tax=Alkalihalobacillus trypoxylicola TaxID=519424 RepID=A0A162CTQ5_9BACI|nr:SDR family oxidoreductase [Alkalihalobacillus trypoxylicola]KYG26613.1 3-oxoacyl-ACP reductase [Alkalihalobacillus trypoxylicola]